MPTGGDAPAPLVAGGIRAQALRVNRAGSGSVREKARQAVRRRAGELSSPAPPPYLCRRASGLRARSGSPRRSAPPRGFPAGRRTKSGTEKVKAARRRRCACMPRTLEDGRKPVQRGGGGATRAGRPAINQVLKEGRPGEMISPTPPRDSGVELVCLPARTDWLPSSVHCFDRRPAASPGSDNLYRRYAPGTRIGTQRWKFHQKSRHCRQAGDEIRLHAVWSWAPAHRPYIPGSFFPASQIASVNGRFCVNSAYVGRSCT